jgi:hypothetical protein
MGKFLNGILDNIRGKVGTIVGSVWKGKPVVRAKSHPRTGKPTQAQVEQQAKFGFMIKFLHPLSPLLNESYKKLAVGMTGVNSAISDNILHAISGQYPAYGVDYPAVLLGAGNLPDAVSPACTSPAAGQLVFTWKNNSGSAKAKATDKAFVAVYSEAANDWIYQLDAAPRSAGTCTLDATAFSGQPVQTWLGLISADGKFVSKGIFAGAVNVL